MSDTEAGWVQSRGWMVASLVLVCMLAALGLARVYLVTKPVIARQKTDATNRALAEVLPAADRFEEQLPDELWFGLDAEGRRVGSVIKVAPRGYAGPIETLAGVDLDGRVTGIFITSLNETPGLGLKAAAAPFRDQFRGRAGNELRLTRDGGALDAISAATITSRAVADGIREGLERFHDRLIPDAPGETDDND
jgi:electron transport complex protein RnfG